MKFEDEAEGLPRSTFERGGHARVEVVLIGGDLLRGQVADANTATLAAAVNRRGGSLRRVTIVDDEEAAIVEAVRSALSRDPHLLVTAGGLGPAADDRTLAAVASALGVPLGDDPNTRAMIEEAYQRLYRSRLVNNAAMNQVREKLCRIPLGSASIRNRRGVSPGVFYRIPGRGAVLCLPGKPEELQSILKDADERLASALPETPWARREVEAPTADESSLRPLLDQLGEEFPGLLISSRPVGQDRGDSAVMIFLEAHAESREAAGATVNRAVRRLLALASGSP